VICLFRDQPVASNFRSEVLSIPLSLRPFSPATPRNAMTTLLSFFLLPFHGSVYEFGCVPHMPALIHSRLRWPAGCRRIPPLLGFSRHGTQGFVALSFFPETACTFPHPKVYDASGSGRAAACSFHPGGPMMFECLCPSFTSPRVRSPRLDSVPFSALLVVRIPLAGCRIRFTLDPVVCSLYRLTHKLLGTRTRSYVAWPTMHLSQTPPAQSVSVGSVYSSPVETGPLKRMARP